MTLMAREISLTYGGVSFGGTSGREIDRFHRVFKGHTTAAVEFDFIVAQTTAALFKTECDTVEAALRKPFQDLVFTMGGQNTISLKQSDGTGLDAQPSIEKIGDEQIDTGRTRRYKVRIEFGLPATTGAEAQVGLRDYTVNVVYAAQRRRTITIAGIYTNNTTTKARAQYEATISALETTIFAALAIAATARQLVEEPVTEQTVNNMTISFQRVWKELLVDQPSSDHRFVDQDLSITRRRTAPGDSPLAGGSPIQRLVEMDVSYTAFVDSDITTNLRTAYESTVRPYILNKIGTFVNGTLAVIHDEPTFDRDNNILTVSMTLWAHEGTAMIEYLEHRDWFVDYGTQLVPVWNGKVLSKLDYQGPWRIIMTLTTTWKNVGVAPMNPLLRLTRDTAAPVLPQAMGTAAKGRHMTANPTYQVKNVGIPPNTFQITEGKRTDVYEYYEPVANSNIATGTGR